MAIDWAIGLKNRAPRLCTIALPPMKLGITASPWRYDVGSVANA
jgi:hypothetical protein